MPSKNGMGRQQEDNRRLVLGILCFVFGSVGTTGANVILFHQGFFRDVVEAIVAGSTISYLIGAFLLALFWGKL